MEHAFLGGAHLDGADLRFAHLDHAFLVMAHLEGANFSWANLQHADFRGARLEGADLKWAHLEHADLRDAHADFADLEEAHLEEAVLWRTRFVSAILGKAHLEGANLSGALLQGASIAMAHLEGATLRAVQFDQTTRLNGAHLDGVLLDQVIFGNTNLAVVEWGEVRRLGDELKAKKIMGIVEERALVRRFGGGRKAMVRRRKEVVRPDTHRSAARTYRALSVSLRAQGVGVHATRFHYRAELMDRYALLYEMGARLRSRRFFTAPILFLRWLGSWLLGTFAGYGDYVGRLFLTYAVVVCTFAAAIFLAGGQALSVDHVRDAMVLSVTSFHGRGVQPPGLPLSDAIATLAGAEAVFGLLIEGIFIAAFTRRVTGS